MKLNRDFQAVQRGVVKLTIVLSVVAFVTIYAAAQQRYFDGKTLWHHVEILAADNMEGRATGSAGLERAEAYVVDQLRRSGLVPAGVNGYFQPVKLLTREIVEKDCSAALVRNGTVEPLILGEDVVFYPTVDFAPKVEAPLVFLGYGLQIPEKNYDDFAGLDLKGKIAVTFPGVPEGIEGPLIARYASAAQRLKQFRDAGLVGWIIVPGPTSGWSSVAADIRGTGPTLHLAGDEFSDGRGERMFMYFNPEHVNKLITGTGHTPAELFGLARDRKRLPRFTLPVSLRATTRILAKPLESANVVAKIEGSDPQLRNEYVVLSAHIDHLGVGTPVRGDRIYNGAIDNASGVAALLDIGAALMKEGVRPRRSVLFTFFTAHEWDSGLFGSKYFTAHPTVDRQSIVANINIDQIMAVVPLKAMLVLGVDESDLGDAARRIAASYSVVMDIDRNPQNNRFTTSSDQASFVFAGIPAVKLNVGFPDEFLAEEAAFRRDRRHTPFDDPQQPINLETVATYEEIARALLLDVANNRRRPQWKSSSVYKQYAR